MVEKRGGIEYLKDELKTIANNKVHSLEIENENLRNEADIVEAKIVGNHKLIAALKMFVEGESL